MWSFAFPTERSRMASNDHSWDVPPDYDSLKHTFDKELPTYHSLYEASYASTTTSQDVETHSPPKNTPPGQSSSNTPCSQKSLPKEALQTVSFNVRAGKEKVTIN